MDSLQKPLIKGIQIEVISIVWMVAEAIASIVAGIAAGSALLTAFGIDSVIELVTAGVLVWRLYKEVGSNDVHKVVKAERIAHWVVVIALALLCLYVLGTSLYGLYYHIQPENSIPGIAITPKISFKFDVSTKFRIKKLPCKPKSGLTQTGVN